MMFRAEGDGQEVARPLAHPPPLAYVMDFGDGAGKPEVTAKNAAEVGHPPHMPLCRRAAHTAGTLYLAPFFAPVIVKRPPRTSARSAAVAFVGASPRYAAIFPRLAPGLSLTKSRIASIGRHSWDWGLVKLIPPERHFRLSVPIAINDYRVNGPKRASKRVHERGDLRIPLSHFIAANARFGLLLSLHGGDAGE